MKESNEIIVIIWEWYWWRILSSKLSKYQVIFFDPRVKDYEELQVLNPIFILVATPSYVHFAIVSKLLENWFNVFCEKPFCSNQNERDILFNMPSINNNKLFIDNVFLYKKAYIDFKAYIEKHKSNIANIQFSWKKYWTFSDTLYNDLVYHDTYMLIDSFTSKDIDFDIPSSFDKKDELLIKWTIGQINFSLYYNRLSKEKKEKNIIIELKSWELFVFDFYKDNDDALKVMLSFLIEDKIDIIKNNRLAFDTGATLEIIKNLING